MHFEKWQGTGNDFIFFDNWKREIEFTPKQIQKLCDRHFGIGADAVILFEPSKTADAKMNYYNADGYPAETCGNGLRATLAYGKEHGYLKGDMATVENPNGRIDRITEENELYTVNLGKPSFTSPDFPADAWEKEYRGNVIHCVSMGNPHCILFVEDIETTPVETLGPQLETDPLFPNRTNVEFVQQLGPKEFRVRVWERGVGETLACGSGMSAVAAMLVRKGIAQEGEEILIHVRGGDLWLTQDADGNMLKKGPAERSFVGEVEL